MLKLRKSKTDPVNRAKGRLKFALGCFLLFFLAIGFRLADLTLINMGQEMPALDPAVAEINEDFDGFRAPILDQKGKPLALSLPLKSLYADAKYIRQSAQTAEKLSALFPTLDSKKLQKEFASKKRFIWVKRHLTPDEQYHVNRLGLPGLYFKDEYRRFYPQKNATAHIMGYTGFDNLGLAGIERRLNESVMTSKEPVSLTLDKDIQHATRHALKSAIDNFEAKAGAAIVMNAKTGALVSMVSLPDFDPHNPGNANTKSRFNRATLGVFEMGSTFKLFSAAAALEHGNIHLDDTFDCRKPLRFGRFEINDYHAQKRIMNVPEIFMHSSNIGHVLMTEKVGTDKIKTFFNELGFLARPQDFDLGEVGRPLVPNPWREINTVTASYGHGIAISPLQLVSAAATMVNGGYKIKPHLIVKDAKAPHLKQRIISEKTSRDLRELLRLTVLEGTGGKADVPGYLVGGKTGTAEKNKGGQYSQKSLISSFLGAFPMDDPEFILYVMVDEPKGNQSSYGYATGGWVAAPAVQTIIQRMTSLLGIPPKTNRQITHFDSNMAAAAVLKKQAAVSDSRRQKVASH